MPDPIMKVTPVKSYPQNPTLHGGVISDVDELCDAFFDYGRALVSDEGCEKEKDKADKLYDHVIECLKKVLGQ